MASNIYGAIALTGGTAGSVDSIKDAVIGDGDMCIAIVGGATDATYVYTFDNSSSTAENSPTVIKPDDAAGNGRWILTSMFMNNGTFAGNVTITGTLGTTGLITATGGLTSNANLTIGDSKSIVLDNAPAATTSASGIISSFTAGENVAFGNFCYLKSDGKYWKADADASTTMPISAMAVATILADAAGYFMKVGYARDDTWNWTVGGILYASTTTGAVTQTVPSGSGDQVQSVGVATHADRLWFFPNFQLVEVK